MSDVTRYCEQADGQLGICDEQSCLFNHLVKAADYDRDIQAKDALIKQHCIESDKQARQIDALRDEIEQQLAIATADNAALLLAGTKACCALTEVAEVMGNSVAIRQALLDLKPIIPPHPDQLEQRLAAMQEALNDVERWLSDKQKKGYRCMVDAILYRVRQAKALLDGDDA